INLERNQFGRESGEPLGLPLDIAVFDHDVAALDVTEVTQSLTEGLCQLRASGPVERQVAYSRDLGRLLGLCSERRDEGTSQRGQQEAAAVHAGTLGRAAAKVNSIRPRERRWFDTENEAADRRRSESSGRHTDVRGNRQRAPRSA